MEMRWKVRVIIENVYVTIIVKIDIGTSKTSRVHDDLFSLSLTRSVYKGKVLNAFYTPD
jgi:hypothetical protein